MSRIRSRRSPSRVFWHIGLPKTGTTYLQQIIWGNRERLLADGIFLPGFGHREHLWAALDLQGRPRLERRNPKAPGSWQRLLDQSMGQGHDVLLTHEFFCAAGRKDIDSALAAFGETEVHLIVTARDPAGMLLAGWQESVKNGSTKTLAEVAAGASAGGPEFSLRTWDLHGVLKRWTKTLASDRVHLLPIPGPDQPKDQHWRNFASVLGLDPEPYHPPDLPANPAVGLVQIELLRRVNAALPTMSAFDRGEWIRGYLAEQRLAAQSGERAVLPASYAAECSARGEDALRLIHERGFHVVGDVTRLVPGEFPAAGRGPDEVAESELLDAAAHLVADMLLDVRSGCSGAASDAATGQ